VAAAPGFFLRDEVVGRGARRLKNRQKHVRTTCTTSSGGPSGSVRAAYRGDRPARRPQVPEGVGPAPGLETSSGMLRAWPDRPQRKTGSRAARARHSSPRAAFAAIGTGITSFPAPACFATIPVMVIVEAML